MCLPCYCRRSFSLFLFLRSLPHKILRNPSHSSPKPLSRAPRSSPWTTSGGFVFITILAGAGSVAAAFIGAVVFEVVRTMSVALLPGAWQLILGTVLLLTILFLPDGIGSLFMRRRRKAQEAVQ